MSRTARGGPPAPALDLPRVRLGATAEDAEARGVPGLRQPGREALGQVSEGEIDFPAVQAELSAKGIELRGGAADEAPGAYKRLDEVLAHHEGTVRVLHTLRPIGVAMAGADTFDPYKD